MAGMARAAIAAAAATIIGSTGSAVAQDFGTGSWYAKGFGGATWPSGEETPLRQGGTRFASLDLDYDTGYTLGAAIGYLYTPNFGVEAEYAYRQADLSGQVDGDGRSNSLMVNAVYVLDGMGAAGAVQPYVGGGIGGASIDIEVEGGDFGSDTLFAYQLFAGVGYDVTPNWTLLGEGRWYATQSGDFDGPERTSFNTSFETFDLLFGATYNF